MQTLTNPTFGEGAKSDAKVSVASTGTTATLPFSEVEKFLSNKPLRAPRFIMDDVRAAREALSSDEPRTDYKSFRKELGLD